MDQSTTLPQSRLAVPDRVDERVFFTLSDGTPTLAGHADLEAVVPNEEKSYLRELERYWVNEPFAFVVIYQHVAQQERRYYLVEPRLTETEQALVEFFTDKLKLSIDYSAVSADATPRDRAAVVRDETIRLMNRYNLLASDGPGSDHSGITARLTDGVVSMLRRRAEKQSRGDETVDPVPVSRDPETGDRRSLADRQVEKTVYYLVRNFIRYDRIDGLKHDVNVEDISCDGYNEPVFVYHGQYGQMLTNVTFGQSALDDFVIKLAQRARKGISKRQPNVDATLADGSRAQLTLGREVSDRGTNFTIRQFREVPFTPVDLVTWGTYSLSQMVYLWLAIENGKSMVIAGGTASGKTTTLNALSLFIPSDSKIVSIEDTRELLVPQRNWVANTTRESFQEDDGSAIDEFDLLEDSLRQRPDYIIMGEVRGEEGRTLFQAMNTGHTVCTTFHANSPTQVIRRFTQEPINVASSMFGAVDIVANQTSTTVDGSRVRRATGIVEIDAYDAEADEFVVDRTYTWDSVTDEIRANTSGMTDLMEQVRRDRGWSDTAFEREWRQRELLLASLIDEGINTYAGVAAVVQAYMHSPDVVMALVSEGELAASIDDLTTMRTVEIDIDPDVESLVPRPAPSEELSDTVEAILDEGDDILDQYDRSDSRSTSAQTPRNDSGDTTTEARPDRANTPEDEAKSGPVNLPQDESGPGRADTPRYEARSGNRSPPSDNSESETTLEHPAESTPPRSEDPFDALNGSSSWEATGLDAPREQSAPEDSPSPDHASPLDAPREEPDQATDTVRDGTELGGRSDIEFSLGLDADEQNRTDSEE